MADIDKLIKRGWTVKSLTAVLTRTIEDDGEQIERTKTILIDEEDLQELAKSDAKDDKATIKDLRDKLKDLRDKRKAAKDELAKLKAK